MPLPPTVSVTTTPSLDGWEIDTYLGPVVAHSVAGTGFLSDWLAGWSDVFGGRSGAYQHQLRSLSDEAILALQQKAARLHANWIVGLTVDMDEISGKGKTMFMVTTMGTAVRARRVRDPDPVVVSTSGDAGPVSAEQVDATRQRVRVLAALEQNTLRFTDETWATLIEQRLAAVLPAVVKTLATLQTTQHAQLASFRERAIAFVERLDPADASAALHESVGEPEGRSQAAIDLIDQAKLRDLRALRTMLETSDPARRRRQLQLLRAEQRRYAVEDVEHLQAIAALCTEEHFPRIATLVTKRGLFGKETVLICECKTERSPETAYCPNSDCDRDASGFTEHEVRFEAARAYCLELATALEHTLADSATLSAIA